MRLRGPRIGRGDNTDQLSFRSSSVLTALRAPNVRFPTLRAAHCCCRCCCWCMPACLANCPNAADVFVSNNWCNCYLPTVAFKKNFSGLAFFSMLLVGIEPGLLSPKSLRLTFTPWRHTTFVFCLCQQLLLIRIAMLLQIILGIYGFIHTPGQAPGEPHPGFNRLLRKIYLGPLFFSSMLPMGIEPYRYLQSR